MPPVPGTDHTRRAAPAGTGIRGVIFDFGGVLTEPPFKIDSLDPKYFGLLAFFLDEMREVYHLPTGAHDLHLVEIGAISEEEFFDRICARFELAGNPPIDPREAQAVVYGRAMIASSAMVDVARQVKAAGYRTAMLTNISRRGERVWRAIIPEELFDVIVDSSRVGMRKPDPRIYLLTCERLDVRPEDCLFIDDLITNVDAAADLGMETLLCSDPVAGANTIARRLLDHGVADDGATVRAGEG